MKLLEKFQLGNLRLKNRVIMAPLTRNRSEKNRVPSELNVRYYAQRAGAGLIITESTVSGGGVGYVNTPGIYNAEQVNGWKKLTDEVHKEGGLIFLQIFHVGRISHPDFLNGALPVAPSDIKPHGQIFTELGLKDYVTPRALQRDEIPGIVEDFRKASQNAKVAGFDGIEIHGANGYLINQFIEDISNIRTDDYGGSVEKRSRFLFDVLEAVLSVWDNKHVGIRLSPSGIFNSMGDSDSIKTYSYIINKLNDYKLAYLHLMNPMMAINEYPQLVSDVAKFYGSLFKGNRIINGGYSQESGNKAIEEGIGELVSFGQLFIANPDLPKRFELNTELNSPNPETYYGGGAEGYIDYPFLEHKPV